MTSSQINSNLAKLVMERSMEKVGKDNEKDDARGIPDKSVKRKVKNIDRFRDDDEVWQMALQKHDADVAGEHFDLRLGDPEKDIGYSWAIPKEMPDYGEKKLAIRQPDHDLDYFDFEGEIKDGYGSGKVELEDRGKVEVLEAGDSKIKFNKYDGRDINEYTMVSMDDSEKQDNWLIINNTKTRDDKDIPNSKVKMDEIEEEELNDYLDERFVLEPKYDGAHSIIDIKPGENPRVYSYREGKNNRGLIEHTWKFNDLKDEKVPEDMPRVKLRGETWAESDEGHALPVNKVSAILNSGVWNSREKQNEEGELRLTAFDVHEHDGRKVEDSDYDKKKNILEMVGNRLLNVETPEMQKDERKKLDLFKRIKKDLEPHTNEGAVLWDRKGEERPKKIKIKPEFDVIIEDIYDAEEDTKYEGTHAGGFEFSWGDGNVAGKVGTGFSDKLRKDMKENPEKYKGLVAKVKAQEVYPSKNENDNKPGALRAPSFKSWHPDKNTFIPNIEK